MRRDREFRRQMKGRLAACIKKKLSGVARLLITRAQFAVESAKQ
jgi:hypothetical protein